MDFLSGFLWNHVKKVFIVGVCNIAALQTQNKSVIFTSSSDTEAWHFFFFLYFFKLVPSSGQHLSSSKILFYDQIPEQKSQYSHKL